MVAAGFALAIQGFRESFRQIVSVVSLTDQIPHFCGVNMLKDPMHPVHRQTLFPTLAT